jgi:hypothetical protein
VFVTLAIAVGLLAAAIATIRSPSARSRPKNLYLLPLVLLASSPIAMVIGVHFWIAPTASPSPTGPHLLTALDLLTFLSAFYFVYRAEGLRWLTTAIVVALLWLYISVSFFVGMSVTGDWL